LTSAPTDPNGIAPGDPLSIVAIIAIGVVGLALFFLPIFIASKRKNFSLELSLLPIANAQRSTMY
jgi:hypothetical protein